MAKAAVMKKATPPSGGSGVSVQEKFHRCREETDKALIERGAEIDLILTALLSREHALLVGPWGCAKTHLLEAFAGWMSGRKFVRLITKFTTPEELFGPVSVLGLKEDKYRRITAGMLPEAHFAMIDEVFKGSTAILNTLLRVMQERKFDNGDVDLDVPLQVLVGGSNEFPNAMEGGQELGALFDRFLLRKKVRYISSAAGRKRLLWGDEDHVPRYSTSITPAEVDEAADEASRLKWATDAKEAMEEILREAHKEGVVVGDRRLKKSVKAVRAYSYLSGRTQVVTEDLEILSHVLWEDPREQPEKVAQVIAKIANPTGMKVNSFLLEAEQVLSTMETGSNKLASTLAAHGKLKEIYKGLEKLSGGNGRVDVAKAHLKEEMKKLQLAAAESIE